MVGHKGVAACLLHELWQRHLESAQGGRQGIVGFCCWGGLLPALEERRTRYSRLVYHKLNGR